MNPLSHCSRESNPAQISGMSCGLTPAVRAAVYHRMSEQRGRLRLQGRILAIDFGMKRLGLAVSDELGITAQGLPTLERTRVRDDLDAIRKLMEEYSVKTVVLGLPLSHRGEETTMSGRVREFGGKLQRRLGCPVEFCDERLTSLEAHRLLRASGISIRKRQQARDRVAATLILQSYLDSWPSSAESARGDARGTERGR